MGAGSGLIGEQWVIWFGTRGGAVDVSGAGE